MTQNAAAFSLTDFPGMEEDLEKVNGHIKRLLSSDLPSMQEMMDYVLGARGKQIRPILTILCSKLHGKQNSDATEMAAIVEIFHTASLIHDDIIDNADTRRGRPSVQQKFGRDMALYAGDFMIFSTVSRKSLLLVNTYEILRSGLSCCDVYGWRRMRPNICSTSTRLVLLANVAKMYAKGQSHPSFRALTVIIYRTSQSSDIRSMPFNSSLEAVLIFICFSGMPKLIRFCLILSNVMLSSSVLG